MMRAEFINGTTVARIWGGLGDGDTLAVFQYDQDALSFAMWKAEDDASHGISSCIYVVADSGRAKITVVQQPKQPEGR